MPVEQERSHRSPPSMESNTNSPSIDGTFRCYGNNQRQSKMNFGASRRRFCNWESHGPSVDSGTRQHHSVPSPGDTRTPRMSRADRRRIFSTFVLQVETTGSTQSDSIRKWLFGIKKAAQRLLIPWHDYSSRENAYHSFELCLWHSRFDLHGPLGFHHVWLAVSRLGCRYTISSHVRRKYTSIDPSR